MEDCQSAYWENFSTEMALIKVKTDILDAIYKKEVMCLVMLDLSATFNTVNHHLLLNRLKYRFGVCDLVLSWLQSYLRSRSQHVIIQNADGSAVESSKRPLLQGIPQGSHLVQPVCGATGWIMTGPWSLISRICGWYPELSEL